MKLVRKEEGKIQLMTDRYRGVGIVYTVKPVHGYLAPVYKSSLCRKKGCCLYDECGAPDGTALGSAVTPLCGKYSIPDENGNREVKSYVIDSITEDPLAVALFEATAEDV